MYTCIHQEMSVLEKIWRKYSLDHKDTLETVSFMDLTRVVFYILTGPQSSMTGSTL